MKKTTSRSTLLALTLLSLVGSAGCVTSATGSPERGPSAGERERSTKAAGSLPPATRDLIEWNERLLAVAEREDAFLTLKGLRSAAMLHLAVHDALAAIDGANRPYLPVSPAPGADARSALAQAAWEIAVSQYPDQRARWDELRDRGLAGSRPGAPRERGIALGRSAAAAILSAREGDGWNGEAEYRWHPMAPGVYAEFREHSGTPEGFVFGAGWAIARPFVLAGPDQFEAPPPPAIESDAYALAFDEVKDLGAAHSAHRTPDQTHLAFWWKDFVENSHNRLARRLVVEDRLDVVTAARLFALLEVSIYDAYLDVFHEKFRFNHWRPYTAIRWAEHDGNAATEADPEWNNTHGHTYAFPSYPSAHGCACGAAAVALGSVFGAERAFDMTISEVDRAGPFSGKIRMDPATRRFPSFAAAARECGLSRLYLGIHFRYDSEEGVALGRRIGEYVVGHALAPVAGVRE